MKHRNHILPLVLSFLLSPFLSLSAAENNQIQSTITSQEQVREDDAQQAVKGLLEKFVLNPDDTSIVYSDGCRKDSSSENCSFYRHVASLGNCGNGEGLSSSKQKSCLKKGLKKLYFFRDHDYLSFTQQKNQLKFRIKLFYFLDGNSHVKNSDGNDIYPITLKQSPTTISITHFPLEANHSFHYEKAKYFFNVGNLESAIEECSIAYNIDRGNKKYLKKIQWYMEEYSKKNVTYDSEQGIENIKEGYSPFYAQGNIEERNYLRSEFNKSNAYEPLPGTLSWEGSFQVKERTLQEEHLQDTGKEKLPLNLTGVEILKFKFGEKENLPDKKPRQPNFEKK